MVDRAKPASATTGGHRARESASDASSEGPRRISSAELLGQQRELMIEHAGEVYHLRATSKGKLILTK
jgi:hemin uptake protein HemP